MLAELEHERAPGGAQRLVDAGEHLAEPVGAVRREQAEPLLALLGEKRLERAVERLAAQHGRPGLLQLAEPGVEADRERVHPQQPVAEAVDRRDPGAVELAGEVVAGRARRARRGSASAARPPPCACT